MQTVTLQVPEALYQRLQRRAAETHRTVEAAVLDVLAGAVPVADDLPADLASALSPLSVLDISWLLTGRSTRWAAAPGAARMPRSRPAGRK